MKNIGTANYQKAKDEADKIEEEIIDLLKSGKSFRVEAGAGSGKTYSLNRVIDWVQKFKWNEYKKKKQAVICITYTNVAVNVIASRLGSDSFVIPLTINSFAWNSISRYQSTLISLIKNNENLHPKEGDIESIKSVSYTLGHRYIDNSTLYLYHDDVIKLFSELLDNQKFRNIFAQSYPLILIDEYQDSFKIVIDKFIEYFISKNKTPQFGFFGDAWQSIYQSNNVCGLIEDDNLSIIKKGSNFRSPPKIVKLLNKIRPSLPQVSAIDNFDGEVIVVTSNDYSGSRCPSGYFKDDLPEDVRKKRLSQFEKTYRKHVADDNETFKILMITHNVLAKQQGYYKLLDMLENGLKDADDPFLVFCMNIVEPIYKSLKESNMPLLFETLSVKRYPINKKSEKKAWYNFLLDLEDARSKSLKDVLNVVINSKLVPIMPEIESLLNTPEVVHRNTTIKDLVSVAYSEFISAITFIKPDAIFSTEHGVKGEEYDNVIFVIGKGWNHYQFEKYVPMLNSTVPEDKKASFERNRNLFYVCCSRPKKRLVLFITIPVEGDFKSCLKDLVGKDNFYNYDEYMAYVDKK